MIKIGLDGGFFYEKVLIKNRRNKSYDGISYDFRCEYRYIEVYRKYL